MIVIADNMKMPQVTPSTMKVSVKPFVVCYGEKSNPTPEQIEQTRQILSNFTPKATKEERSC